MQDHGGDLHATDNAEPQSSCKVCNGNGFVVRERNYDHPRFGRVDPCRCILGEPPATRRERLERLSQLGTLTRLTFTTLSPLGRDGRDGSFDAALSAAISYSESPNGWLVFTGPSGSGKTHLAAAIANRRIQLGEPALFMVAPDLLDHLRASYGAQDSAEGFPAVFDQVRNAALLVLDDLDSTAGSPWAKEKLFQIVNHRYNSHLPTVFTLSKLESLDDRLISRLQSSELSKCIGLGVPVASDGTYWEVGGMSRERLLERQFGDLIDVKKWTSEERQSFRAAVTTCTMYAEEPDQWLVLMGASGCGKTHLACAIANKLLRRGRSVFFAMVPDLLDHLRASFGPTAEASYTAVFERVRTADLLILDDLGAQKTSSWAMDKLFQIVNYRAVARLATIVTTDLREDGLREAYPRAFTRMCDPHYSKVVELLAPHYVLGPASPPANGAPARRRGPQ